ncbi:MAG: hypothetical protein EOM72_02540 [Opitutae bacterium]|nr:hypothetical protein [Opitutae bacterium]
MFYKDEGGDLIASEPLIVRVSLFSKLGNHLFWMVLLPFLVLKENRTRKALWIFLPYGAWMGVAAGLSAFAGGASAAMMPLPTILGGLLLAGGRIHKWNGWIVLVATVLFAALVHGIWAYSGQVENVMYASVVSAVLFLVTLVSFLLARLGCRRRYGALPLALFLLPAVMIFCLLIAGGAAISMFLKFREAGGGHAVMMLLGMCVPALVVGGLLYLLLLSFLAVPFSTELYRQRLCGLLKLKREAPPAPEPPPMPSVQP